LFQLSEDIPDSGTHALEGTDSMKERGALFLPIDPPG